jgi:hypothetical protein
MFGLGLLLSFLLLISAVGGAVYVYLRYVAKAFDKVETPKAPPKV